MPSKPVDIVTTQVTNVNVKIAWTPPFTNYKPITAYQVQIGVHGSTTDFIESTSLCDGSKSYIMSVNYCIVPIASLRNAPYNLERLELIRVRFRA